MGIDINTARFFISAYQDSIRFGKVLTLGKQNLYVKPSELSLLKAELKRLNSDLPVDDLQPKGLADPIFQAFDSTEVLSMDKSDFEGADLLHDMNFPVSESYKEQFDLVYDGGTLEHIFNFPIAIQNIMEMVKVGGHLIIQTPTNNWSGHGFYQFSPELYFRVLSAENGYKIKRMVVFEWGPNNWYEVSDPLEVNARVYVVNNCRTSLLILAERVTADTINQTPPQQSDYAFSKWTADKKNKTNAATPTAPKRKTAIAIAKQLIPRRLLETVKTAIGKKPQEVDYFSCQPRFFKPVDK